LFPDRLISPWQWMKVSIMLQNLFVRRWSWLLSVSLVAVPIGGCTPAYPNREKAIVQGTVTYQSEPLTMGTIMFQPESGAFTSGEIQPDGTYSLEGVVGPNRVMIVSREPNEAPAEGEPPGSREPPNSYIPDTYGGPTSGLQFNIEAGENTADFDLK